MTTVTLHATVQRSRFAQHAVAMFTNLLPMLRNSHDGNGPTAAESASIEAQKVRRLAQSYASTDPGFAADLYAAAARHEGIHTD